MDQADKLRQIVWEQKETTQSGDSSDTRFKKELLSSQPLERKSCRVIAVTSGKGGVGKSNLVTNLALALASCNKQVLVLDADLGLANVDVLVGINPRYNLSHAISGKKLLSDIVVSGPLDVKIVPGATGIWELANLDDGKREKLLADLHALESHFDFVLIDTGAGISRNVLGFVLSAHDVVVVTTPEPTAVMDAYSLIKVTVQQAPRTNLHLVVNMAQNDADANQTSQKILLVSQRFLGVKVNSLGTVFADRNVSQAVTLQQPFFLTFPSCRASRCVRKIAQRILTLDAESNGERGLSGFLKKLLTQITKI